DVLPQGVPAARTPALAGPTDALSQAVQAFAGGRGLLGSLKADPASAGNHGGGPDAPLPPPQGAYNGGFSGSPWNAGWAVGDPSDPYVFGSYGPLGTEAGLGSVGRVNTLTQVAIYTPAAYYTISFDLENDDPYGGESQFTLQWNGANLVNLVN